MLAVLLSLLLLAAGSFTWAMHGGSRSGGLVAETTTHLATLPVAIGRGVCGHERHVIRADSGRALLGLSEPRAGGAPTTHARNEWVLPPTQASADADRPRPLVVAVIGRGSALAQTRATIAPRGPPALSVA